MSSNCDALNFFKIILIINNSSHSTRIRVKCKNQNFLFFTKKGQKICFSHFTLIRVECEELFCKTNIKLLKLIFTKKVCLIC